jgi:hypothetical protein
MLLYGLPTTRLAASYLLTGHNQIVLDIRSGSSICGLKVTNDYYYYYYFLLALSLLFCHLCSLLELLSEGIVVGITS